MKRKPWWVGVLLWFTPFIASTLVTNFVMSTVTISGVSMAPSFADGQRVVLSKIDKAYQRGEIVVFTSGGNDPTATGQENLYVKRVIGVAGDTVRYKDGKLYVNDKEVRQDFLQDSAHDPINSAFEKEDGTSMPENNYWSLEDLSDAEGWNEWSKGVNKVPEGCVFVMGDHRSASKDSRFFGYVKTDSIIGVVKQMPFSNEQTQSVMNDVTDQFFVE